MGSYKDIIDYYKKIMIIKQIEGVLDWDMNVNLRPGGYDSRGEQGGYLAKLKHSLLIDKQFNEKLNCAFDEYDLLTDAQKYDLSFIKREADLELKIPESLVVELAQITAVATGAWEDAKKSGDDSKYLQYLERIFSITGEYIKCKDFEDDPYDALLDDYDRGLKYKDVEAVFSKLKISTVDILDKFHNTDRESHKFCSVDESLQKEISEEIVSLLHINKDYLRLDESTHPFTSTLGFHDVRITTKYIKDDFTSSMFSTMHEAGHALYELGVQSRVGLMPHAELVSLSLHESQSRFYENIIGRSFLFIEYFLERIKGRKILTDISAEKLYHAVNTPLYTPIRTDSDEISYNLHIILRTGIEHDLINGNIKVKDINEVWNQRFYSIFGEKIPSKKEGYLQDIHWAGGGIGYFPTYTMGNIIAAQFADRIEKDIGVIGKKFDEQTFHSLGQWFSENLYKYGNSLTSSELVKRVTGESINQKYLINHLENRSGCIR